MTRIAIVGNGPLKSSDQEMANDHDCVIRFGSPPTENINTDSKTDILFITNSKKQTRSTLNKKNYLDGIVFRSAKKIVLPYHQSIINDYMPKPSLLSRLKGARADLTDLCISVATEYGKSYEILDRKDYLELCRLIGFTERDLSRKFLSAGVMAIYYATNSIPEDSSISIFGFSFQGWKRHDWTAEAKYIKSLADSGRVRINDCK